MTTPESIQKLTQLKDIILTAQKAKQYVDDINAALSLRIQALSDTLNALVGNNDTTAAIDTFNEVVAFLNGIEGTTLDELLTTLRQSVQTLTETKQDIIADLATIRSGAAAGATAYQKPSNGIPKSDMTATVAASLNAADNTTAAMNAAKGNYTSLAARLTAIDTILQDLIDSATGGGSGGYASIENRVAELERQMVEITSPGSVGTEQIKDGSIKLEDLSEEVKEGLDELNNISLEDEDLEEIFFPDSSGDDS